MWIEGMLDGVYRRESLKVHSWEKAEKIRREMEEGKTVKPVSIAEAIEIFLAEQQARALAESTLRKLRAQDRRRHEAHARGNQRRPLIPLHAKDEGSGMCSIAGVSLTRTRNVRGGEKRHHFRRDRAEPVAPVGWPIGGDRYGLYISV
jgi:hypothetical protein